MSQEFPFLIRGAGGGVEPSKARTPIEVPEGISGQKIESGNALISVPRAVSLTKIKVWDLISEGEIEGLVSGDYVYDGTVGKVGFNSATFVPYLTKSINSRPISYLRSIYWNETPVVDKDNLFNFQQIDVAYSNGLPNGSSEVGIGDELTISRNIQERLRGPNAVLDNKNKLQIVGQVEQFAKYYRILNRNCVAVNVNVRVNALSATIVEGKKAGDVTSTSLQYAIYYKPLFSNAGNIYSESVGPEESEGYLLGKEETIEGKVSFGYIRSTRIDFDQSYTESPGFVGWAIKIFRYTPDSLQGNLRNQTYVESLTEVYASKFCYPHSAVVVQSFSAEYFSQIPGRAFDAKLLKVKIPSNYDPITKTYYGDWDGEWKTDANGNEAKFWTDNPAWCFYDLITNKRYGLGKFIDESLVDKWTLYEISQYCDTLVPDGLGGVEPRFTCNLILTSREEAYKVLNDMASIFRSIIYYLGGGVFTSMDTQKEPIFQFNNSNVEDGEFGYSSSSKRVRHSVAIVRYNDKNNFYQPAIEYVEDAEAIKKYGYREFDATAFGCTSRGQAIRYGRWALLSEGLETETISFNAGLDASILRPGDIFSVYDQYKYNKRHGGRILDAYNQAVSGNSVIILDQYVTGLSTSTTYNLTLTTPTFDFNPTTVSGLNSQDIRSIRNKQIQNIYFSGGDVSLVSGRSALYISKDRWSSSLNFDAYNIPKYTIWSLEQSGDNDAPLSYYRVIKIEEKDNKYAINALQYEVSKYNAIDSGLNFQGTIAPVASVGAPDNLTLTFKTIEGTNLKGIEYQVTKNNMDGVYGFLVYAKLSPWAPEDFTERFTDGTTPQVVAETPNSVYNINILTNSENKSIYIPLSNGTYYFRAYARNYLGIPSTTSVEASITVSALNSFQSLVIQSLRAEGNTDKLLLDKAQETVVDTEPVYTWQSAFENEQKYTIGDLYYRVTFRKSTNEEATDALQATTDEVVVPNDPYQPSNAIFYEKAFYRPNDVNNPSFKLDLLTNIAASDRFYGSSITTDASGVLREYDVVVEAHLSNGQSSAGGSISGLRKNVSDSAFNNSNKKGWDILYVNNPKIPSIQLTQNGALDQCLVQANNDINALTALNKVCSEQWIASDGTVNIKIHSNNLPTDIAGGYIYSCTKEFTASEAYYGKKGDGTIIKRAEFLSLSDPIVATSDLMGFRSGWIAVSFYDNLDKAFKDERIKTVPDIETRFISGLNISNCVAAKARGASEPQSKYAAWCKFDISMQPRAVNGNDGLKINSLSWVGVGVKNCEINGFDYEGLTVPMTVNVKVNFDSEFISSVTNAARVLSYEYSTQSFVGSTQNELQADKTYISDARTFILENKQNSSVISLYTSGKSNVEYKNIASDNSSITLAIMVPHGVNPFYNVQTNPSFFTDAMLNKLVECKTFIGLMANIAENINFEDVSAYTHVRTT